MEKECAIRWPNPVGLSFRFSIYRPGTITLTRCSHWDLPAMMLLLPHRVRPRTRLSVAPFCAVWIAQRATCAPFVLPIVIVSLAWAFFYSPFFFPLSSLIHAILLNHGPHIYGPMFISIVLLWHRGVRYCRVFLTALLLFFYSPSSSFSISVFSVYQQLVWVKLTCGQKRIAYTKTQG